MAPTKLIAAAAIAFGTARFSPARELIGPFTTFFAVFVTLLLLNLAYACFIYPFYVSPLRHLPTPEGGHPIFGHGLTEMHKTTPGMMNDWKDFAPGAPLIRYLSFFGEEKVVPWSAEAVRQVFNNESIRWPSIVAQAISSIVGDGILFLDGMQHKALKKRVMPAFTPSQQRHLVPSLWEVAKNMNAKMKAALLASGEETTTLDIDQWTNHVTFDMIGRTAWGSDFKGLEDPEDYFVLFDRNYPSEPETGLNAILIYVLPIFIDFRILNLLPFKRYQDQLADRRLMADRFMSIVATARENQSQADSEGNHKDILSSLLACKDLTDYELIQNMQTFTVAGFGTNGAMLVWAVYVFALYPAVLNKLRAEVRRVLKDPNTPVTSAEMDEMTYLHCFVMEVARLYPSVHTTWRSTQADDIVVAGMPLPKDTSIIVSSFANNRNKATWGEDAEEFRPERWEPENRQKGVEHNGMFVTYALGRKVCIGKEYSLRAMKATLIALTDFTFAYNGTDPLKRISPSGTLRVSGGLKAEVGLAEPW